MRLFLLSSVLGVSLAVAQSTEAPKNARLEGQVLSTAGGPVKNVTFRLLGRSGLPAQPPGMYSQSSDNDGKFAFDAIPPGTYLLVVMKDGFRPDTASPSQFTLTSGQVMTGVIIKLNPLGVITGRVTDQDGDPVPNAQVSALHYTYLGGVKQLVTGGLPNEGYSQSDDKGNFRIFNLEPGRYYVKADPQYNSGPVGDQRPRESDVTTYYPSSLGPGTATPLNLVAGSGLSGIDIRVRKVRVYSIRGKALDSANGGLAVNAMISLSSKEDSSLATSILSRDGMFQLPFMVPGTYVLEVRPRQQLTGGQTNGNPSGNFIGRVEVTISDSDVDDVVLSLTPASPFDIVGSIKVEDGDLKQLNGTLRDLPLLTLRQVEVVGSMLRPTIQGDGTLKFQGVMPGRYLVDFSLFQTAANLLPTTAPTQGVYVKSVRFAGHDVNAPLNLTSVKEGNLQIVLSGKAAVIAGTARNSQGNTLSSARVSLWPKSPDPLSLLGGLRFTILDPNGSFRFNGLAPGDYYLAAWEDVVPGLFEDPEIRSLFTRDASSVKLGEGANETVEVKLISSEKIAAGIATLP